MSDTGRKLVVCDNRCGCTVPCAGGSTCRCTSSEGGARSDHSTCPCGEHCQCNPCNCSKTVAAGSACRCDASCTCASCRT
ncbi:unnamed protein product [Lathyrus sativus]|nr:unnamed protein product [Lathyrus sativus]